MFAAAVLIFIGSVVMADRLSMGLYNLYPQPDSPEYFAMMRNILDGRGATIRIAGEDLPSRYPPGFPALGVPALWLLPAGHELFAPFAVNMVVGGATLLLAYGYYAKRGDSLRGGIAALLIASLPAFMCYSRSSMSEPVGAFLIVSGFLAMRSASQGKLLPYLLSAALLGLALNVRVAAFYYLPLLGMPLICDKFGSWRRRAVLLAASATVVAVMTLPTALINYLSFGSPLRFGYGYWVPHVAGFTTAFSLEHVIPNLRLIWAECTLAGGAFTTAHLFSTGMHFTPALVPILALFAVPRPWTAFHVAAAITGTIAVALSLCYFFLDLRLYYTLVLLAIIAASGGLSRALRSWRTPGKIMWPATACVLLAAAVIGYPSLSGFPWQGWRSQLWDGVTWSRRTPPTFEFEAASLARRTIGAGPALLLSDISPVYLSSLLSRDVVCASVDPNSEYRESAVWRFDASSVRDLVSRHLRSGLPVFALAQPVRRSDRLLGLLPAFEGYRWTVVAEDQGRCRLWQLRPIS